MSAKILAIDLGLKNLAYAFRQRHSGGAFGALTFGVLDKDLTKMNMSVRLNILDTMIKPMIQQHDIIVIEKQHPHNVVMMCIMYAICAICQTLGKRYIVYDPKLKFKFMGIEMNTKNKKHKTDTIKWVRERLENYGSAAGVFDSFIKKDDISDAIVMLLDVESSSS